MDFLIHSLVAAIIPLLIGNVWYHPKVLGNLWMRESGLRIDQMNSSKLIRNLVILFVFAFMLALSMHSMVIHQFHLQSIIEGMPDANGAMKADISMMMTKYGANFRTFKHGALHGFMSGLFIALPIIGINALFEQKSWKYILIHVGYWCLSMLLMGGLICAWV